MKTKLTKYKILDKDDLHFATFEELMEGLSEIFGREGYVKVVEEKIDGIHVTVVEKNGALEVLSKGSVRILKSRMGEKERSEIVTLFYGMYERFQSVMDKHALKVIHLEYVPREKPSYLKIEYREGARGIFYLLDSISRSEKFVELDLLREISKELGVPIPKTYLESREKIDIEKIVGDLVKGVYRSDVSKDGEPEGVVVKAYCAEEMFGFKLRRLEDKDFLEKVSKSAKL